MHKFNFNEISMEFDKEKLEHKSEVLDYQAEIELELVPNVEDQIFIDGKTYIVRKIIHVASNESEDAHTMIFGTKS